MEKPRSIHKLNELFDKHHNGDQLEDERLYGVPDALQTRALEAQFLGTAGELRGGDMDEPAVSDAIHDRARQYLEDNGIHEADDPHVFDQNYQLIRHIAYHGREQWEENDDVLGKTPRQYMVDDLKSRYSYPAMENHDDTYETVSKDLKGLADKYGKLLAKRANKTGLLERTRKLEQTKTEFDDLLSAAATEFMIDNETSDTPLSDDDLNAAIAAFIDEQTMQYVERMEQYRIEKAASRNRVVKFATEKWASWTPRSSVSAENVKLLSWKGAKHIFRNIRDSYSKENWKGTVAKNTVAALGGAALTTIVSPFVAVGAVGGAAAFFGTRAARTYAMQKIGSAADAERIATEQRRDIEARIAVQRAEYDTDRSDFFDKLSQLDSDIAAAEAAGDTDVAIQLRAEKERCVVDSDSRSFHEIISDLITERAAAYRSENQKRLLAGTALALTFGAGGAAVASHFDFSNHLGPLQQKAEDARRLINDATDKARNFLHLNGDQADQAQSNGLDNDVNHESLISRRDREPTLTGGERKGMEADSLFIKPGQGWYEIFKQTGMPTAKLDAALNDPELQSFLLNNGIAEKMPDGSIGVHMPDGALTNTISAADRKGMVDILQRKGYFKVETDSHPPANPTQTQSEAFVVERGHGLIKEIREWGSAHGYKLSGAQAEKIYWIIRGEHGDTGIIDLKSIDGVGKDVYHVGNDLRISAPDAEAHWQTGVETDLTKLAKAASDGDKLSADILHAKGTSPGPLATGSQPKVSDTSPTVAPSSMRLESDGVHAPQIVDANSDSISPATPSSTQQIRIIQDGINAPRYENIDTSGEATAGPALNSLPASNEALADTTEQLKGMSLAENNHANGSDMIPWQSLRSDAQQMNQMIKDGNISAINKDPTFQKTLDYIRHDLNGMTYPNSNVKVIEWLNNSDGGRWYINDNPSGNKLPTRVVAIFEKYVNRLQVLAP